MGINKYILEIVIFVCGAVVMIFELIGSRVLGPYFGTSIFVWTSLIGIILGSLSIGYYFGGKIADKKPSFESLSLIIFFGAMFVGLTTLIKDLVLSLLQNSIFDVRIASVFASIVLFSPASIFLGMVSPYAVKLKIKSLSTSASTVGNLYAISTTGSIVGTFLSGFYLIPSFGTNKLLIIVTITLIIISLILSTKRLTKINLLALFITIIYWVTVDKFDSVLSKNNQFIDVDTVYNRVWIYNYKDASTGRLTKMMGINNENQSSMFVNSNELVNEYTKYYSLAKHFNPNFKKTLMLGGAGYSYPKDFLAKYKTETIDVIEIDPKITNLAKKYFRLKENSRLNIYHTDGRVFLNTTKKKYDVIFGDAFGSRYSLPYQLTTKQAVQKKYDILNNNGIVILNIISAIDGRKGRFLRAEYLTYKSIFPQVYLFPVAEPNNGKTVQNIILIALKSQKKQIFKSTNQTLDKYLKHVWRNPVDTDMPILTDDFAPVDYYINGTI